MTGAITNHVWQSTVFAVAVALVVLAFRKNRASVRYGLWLCASMKFLVPFALLMSAGSAIWNAIPSRNAGAVITASAVSQTVEQIAEPFAEDISFVSAAPHAAAFPWQIVALAGIWGCGAVAISAMRLYALLRVRAVLRGANRIEVPGTAAISVEVRSSETLLEPGVVGFLRPVLLLPDGIVKRLTPAQLQTVVAHELAHVRRRDNLTAALHMLVEAIFWFHPAVWWIGARLIEERERACDEAVLSRGSEPRDYAESILNVCKSYLESPIICVSGVTGSDIKRRIERITRKQIGEKLSRGGKAVLACVGVAAVALPIVLGLVAMPALRAQTAVSPVPKWEVISIKPCDASSNGTTPGTRGGANGPPPASFSPTRMTLNCQLPERLIQDAYLLFPNAQAPESRIFAMYTPIEGMPDWARNQRYTIEATADASATPEMMEGPMLQSLLEERFKFKVRRETREVPLYDLVVAKGGPKLAPFVEGTCVPFPMPDIVTGPPVPTLLVLPGGQKYCSHGGGLMGPTAVNIVITDDGDTVDGFCKDFLNRVGNDHRRVVDKTGLAGKYTIHLEYAPDEEVRNRRIENGRPLGEPTAPEIFTAIQEQLGLKLVPSKGPGDFLVIEHIEKPSEN